MGGVLGEKILEALRVQARVHAAAGLVFLAAVAAPPGRAGPALWSNLVAYYDFEALDAAGLTNRAPAATGYQASRYGGGTFDSSANPSGPGFAGSASFNNSDGPSDRGGLLAGKALNLVDSRNDALVVPLGTSELGQTFSISTWHALTPGTSNASPRYHVFEASTNYDVSWGTPPSAAGPLASYSYYGYVGSGASLPASNVSTYAWHHAVHVFVRDGTNTTLTVYLDGSPVTGTRTAATSAMSFSALHFGRARTGTDDRDWDGMLDEVAVWTRALSPAEVTQLYDLGAAGQPLSSLSEPGPTVRMLRVNPYQGVNWDTVGHRKGNLHTHSTQSDGSLPPAGVIDAYHALGYEVLALTDHNLNTWPWTNYGRTPAALGLLAVSGNELSRHHHVGSLFSSFTTTSTSLDTSLQGVAAQQGLAILNHPAYHWLVTHTGVTAEIQIPLQPAMRAITQGDFSLEAWFRTTDAGRHVLMGNYESAVPGALNLELHTGNRVRVYLQPVTGTTVDLNVSADALGIDTRDGAWHHLAAARNGGAVRLYLDGRLAGQAADTAGFFDLQNDVYHLGRDSRTGSTALRGDLDHVRLWVRGLSAAEVTNFTAGASPAPGETAILAEYHFETSGGVPVVAADYFEGPVDDTAGHAQGPFPALASGAAALSVIADPPAALQAAGASHYALKVRTAGLPPDLIPYYAGIFTQHPVLVGMEVLNGTTEANYPLDRALWDGILATLMPQRPVWGLAVDDMHNPALQLGHDRCVFLTATLDEASVRQSLQSGAFYFSTTQLIPAGTTPTQAPPRIDRITHDPGAGRLAIRALSDGVLLPETACVWIANGVAVHTGSTLDYRATAGIGNYVRAEITGPGGTAFTSPFGFAAVDEAQDTDQDSLPDWWEEAYFGGPTAAVATALSPSGTGLRNLESFIAGTNPLDAHSLFALTCVNTNRFAPDAFVLRWPSVSGRVYAIDCASSLSGNFTVVTAAQSLAATAPQNHWPLWSAVSNGFFRLRVRLAE